MSHVFMCHVFIRSGPLLRYGDSDGGDGGGGGGGGGGDCSMGKYLQ